MKTMAQINTRSLSYTSKMLAHAAPAPCPQTPLGAALAEAEHPFPGCIWFMLQY